MRLILIMGLCLATSRTRQKGVRVMPHPGVALQRLPRGSLTTMTVRNAALARAICTQELCLPRSRAALQRLPLLRVPASCVALQRLPFADATAEAETKDKDRKEAREARIDEDWAGEPSDTDVRSHNSVCKTAQHFRTF